MVNLITGSLLLRLRLSTTLSPKFGPQWPHIVRVTSLFGRGAVSCPMTISTRRQYSSLRTASPGREVEAHLKKERLTENDMQTLHGRFSFTTANALKLVMPMPNKTDVVAFLLHTQQPLSYLETLIRNELPDADRKAKIEFMDIHRHARWSTSIQISDFIREAAATRRFCVDIYRSENKTTITINVPSFEDRTYFLRAQLGRLTQKCTSPCKTINATIANGSVQEQYKIKTECDHLAKKTAQTYALAGMGGLVVYWVAVCHLTFYTSLGWDVMEPLTYLASLSAIIVGYCWFLYHNRDVSYSSVLHTAATVRQQRLYRQKGFDILKWRDLIDQGKDLRKEIRLVAEEYNVIWDEGEDKYIPNDASDASEVLRREEKADGQHKTPKSSHEEDLEDDGEVNGSNEVAPDKSR